MRRLRDWWWALLHRFHPSHRYNVVQTGLPPEYYDPCVRLLWAVFSETERFVDNAAEIIQWDSDSEHAKAWEILTTAVQWWRDNRPDKEYGCEWLDDA